MVTGTKSKLGEAQARRDRAAQILGEMRSNIEAFEKELAQVLARLERSFEVDDPTPWELLDRRDELVNLIPRTKERARHAEKTLALEQSRLSQVVATVNMVRGEIVGYETALKVHVPAKRHQIEAKLAGMSTSSPMARGVVEAQLAQISQEEAAVKERLVSAQVRLGELIGERQV